MSLGIFTALALVVIAAIVAVTIYTDETEAHECGRYERHQHEGGTGQHVHDMPGHRMNWVDKSGEYGGTWHDHCLTPALPDLDAGDGRTPSAVWWWR